MWFFHGAAIISIEDTYIKWVASFLRMDIVIEFHQYIYPQCGLTEVMKKKT